MKDFNYYDTFIQVAADSPVTESVIPVAKKPAKSIHVIQYELLSEQPYTYSQEELLYEVHVRHKGYTASELAARGDEIRFELFQKNHACLRASALPKKYGWGIHFNAAGKIGLYAMETEAYQNFVSNPPRGTKLIPAMRNSRAK